MGTHVHIVIVTHNSEREIPVCLDYLEKQIDKISSLVIVDSGSTDSSYLDIFSTRFHNFLIIKTENIGFSQSNDLGFTKIDGKTGDIVIFLNPDTFLPPDFLSNCRTHLSKDAEVGALSGKLLGFDLDEMAPTGAIDSTGIFRAWYGRWCDRGQGEKDAGQYNEPEYVPALCGALFCCKYEALESLGKTVFDPDFFLYKEDIELSLRLRKKGWKLKYEPKLIGYHCRGWQKERSSISYSLRLTAAYNEMLLYRKHPSPYIIWAICKYLLVKIFRL